MLTGYFCFSYWRDNGRYDNRRETELYIDNPTESSYLLVVDDDSVAIPAASWITFPLRGNSTEPRAHHFVLQDAQGRLLSDTSFTIARRVFLNPSRSTYVRWRLPKADDHEMLTRAHWLRFDSLQVYGQIDTSAAMYVQGDDRGLIHVRPPLPAGVDGTEQRYHLRRRDFLAAYSCAPPLGEDLRLHQEHMDALQDYVRSIPEETVRRNSTFYVLRHAWQGRMNMWSMHIGKAMDEMMADENAWKRFAPAEYVRAVKAWKRIGRHAHDLLGKSDSVSYTPLTRIEYETRFKGRFSADTENYLLGMYAVDPKTGDLTNLGTFDEY